MTHQEFYEKYWTVNGKPVLPLRDVDIALFEEANSTSKDNFMRSCGFKKKRMPIFTPVNQVLEDQMFWNWWDRCYNRTEDAEFEIIQPKQLNNG